MAYDDDDVYDGEEEDDYCEECGEHHYGHCDDFDDDIYDGEEYDD